MSFETKFFATGPGSHTPPGVRDSLEHLCKNAYSGLAWYEQGTTPPLIQQIDSARPGGICYVSNGGQIVAAHGFLDMETKIRLTSWGPVLSPDHEDQALPLIAGLIERGKDLGKDRVVVVLRGKPDGEDTRWYAEQHRAAGIDPIMTRMDMEVSVDQLSLRKVAEPEGTVWHEIGLSNLDDFLPVYGEVFATSESPLARSWAQDAGRCRWWFEQMAQGAEGEIMPGGWVTLAVGGKPLGVLLVTLESKTKAHISDLGLIESARGKHLGWVLMNRAVDLAKKSGAKIIDLGVEVENRVAIAFYEVVGFRAASRTTVLLKRFQ